MAVGIMVLPAASARLWARSLGGLLALATGMALAACVAGLLLSYHLGWPASSVIVLCLGAGYIASLALGPQGLWRGQARAH